MLQPADQPTNKDRIETMCRNAGLMPEERRTVRGYDLLIADGFSLPPHRAFRRFGVEAGEYPAGCFVTFWWLMKGEDRLFVAGPLIFDVFHNPEYDRDTKKQARLNRAALEAEVFVRHIDKVRADA